MSKGGTLQLIDRIAIDSSGIGPPVSTWLDLPGRRIVVAGSGRTLVWSPGGIQRVQSPCGGINHTFLWGDRLVWITTKSGEPGPPGSLCAITVQELGGRRQEIANTYILAHSDNDKHLLVENADDKSIWLLSRK